VQQPTFRTEPQGRAALVNLTPELVTSLDLRLTGSLGWEEICDQDRLSAVLEQGTLQSDVVLLGAGVEKPVAAAQHVHRFDKTISVLILVDPDHYAELRRAIMFSPLRGSEVSLWPSTDIDGLSGALMAAVERRVQRRTYLSTIASTQLRLGRLSLSQPEANRYLDHLLDHAPVGILSIDRAGLVLNLNRQAGQILGVVEREALGLPLADFFPQSERKRFIELITQSAAASTPNTAEVFAVRPAHGTVRFLEATASPLAYHVGQRGFMLILQDVTGREKAERERKRAEEDLRVHAGLLHVFHKITSAQGLAFEEKLIRLLRLSCERFKLPIGMLSRIDGEYHEVLVSIPGNGAFAPGRRYRPPDIYWGTCEQTADQVGSEEASDRDSAARPADPDSRLGAYIGVQVMVDGDIFGALCFRSIEPRSTPFSSTDREVLKLMAQWVGSELQRTKSEAHMRRLSSALEQTAETVIIADKNRLIEYVNPAFEQLTGYAKNEAIGQKSSFLRHDILEPSFYEKLWQSVSGGQVFRGVLANRKKDGAIYFEEKTITPMRDPEGKITHYISTGHDVTEKKNAEEAARRHQAELAHVARLSTLGEMTSGLAHELNQPLCAITTYAQTCLRLLSAENCSQSEVRYGLEQVVKQAELAGAIFRRLRNFARKGEFVRQRVSMRNIVAEVADLIKAELAQSEIILKVEGVRATTYVEVDPIQIEQVILNLIRNSMDAMAGNGAIDKNLTIRTEKIGKTEVKVSISDTGHGCRPEVVERLFEPFFSTKPTGLGIGLGLSQTIIEAHGGKLWLESTCDAGATFSFVLPSHTGSRHVNSEDKAANGLHRR